MPTGERERVGVGRLAEVFAWGEGRVLRLARSNSPEAVQRTDREVFALCALAGTGVAAPAFHERVEVDGRPGTVVDRCEGTDLLRQVQARPWTVLEAGRTLGRLHAAIHEVTAPAGLPRMGDWIAGVPDGDRLCHGDFHPGNVLGEAVIDWDTACAGAPEADVARTCVLLIVAEPVEGTPAYLRRLMRVGRRLLLGAYLRAYKRCRPLDLELVERLIPVLARGRLVEGLESERDVLLPLAGAERVGLPGRRALDAEHRRFLVEGALLGTAVVNAILNAAPAWLSALGRDSVPLLSTPFAGGPSTIMDTIGTFFFLPLITTIVVTLGVRRAIAAGRMRRLSWLEDPVPFLGLLPAGPALRGLLLGAGVVAVLGPPAAGLLWLTGFGDVSVAAFVAYKTVLGVALGAVVTPVVALGAISEILPDVNRRGET